MKNYEGLGRLIAENEAEILKKFKEASKQAREHPAMEFRVILEPNGTTYIKEYIRGSNNWTSGTEDVTLWKFSGYARHTEETILIHVQHMMELAEKAN